MPPVPNVPCCFLSSLSLLPTNKLLPLQRGCRFFKLKPKEGTILVLFSKFFSSIEKRGCQVFLGLWLALKPRSSWQKNSRVEPKIHSKKVPSISTSIWELTGRDQLIYALKNICYYKCLYVIRRKHAALSFHHHDLSCIVSCCLL